MKRIAGLFALFVLSSLAGLVFLEFALRAVAPRAFSPAAYYRIPHPVLGWSLQPEASYTNLLPEGEVEVRYNERGWRDVEHELSKPNGSKRILVLGDSFMEAYSVPLQASFPRRVEKLLTDRGYNVEVINLGVGGYGTLQARLAFETEGRLYTPDIVVLAFYLGNDVRNNSRELESGVNPKGAKIDSRPFLVRSGHDGWTISEIDFTAAQQRFQKRRESRSPAAEALLQRSALARNLAHLRKGTGGPDDAVSRDDYLAALYGTLYCKQGPAHLEAWITTERILGDLAEDVRRAGAELVVMTVPGMIEVDESVARAVGDQLPVGHVLCVDEPPGYEMLATITERLELPQVDLLPRFREATREEAKALFHLSDRHWNTNGHGLAAETMAHHLAGVIERSSPQGETGSVAPP